jgi:SecD/SecF fusion protein
MKQYYTKFAFIIGTTLIGLLACLPPREKLKLGIDLSGGTILVYEADRMPQGTKIDDLIAALKQRINPQGVLDIPIRRVSGNRIEIILANASADEVEEKKRLLTDMGSLEFRILANVKHDRAAVDRARGPNGLKDTPERYDWALVGDTITGSNPQFSTRSKPPKITDLTQNWQKHRYAGNKVELTGRDSNDKTVSEEVSIADNTTNTLSLAQAPARLRTITSYKIEYNPSGLRDSDETIIRERPKRAGYVEQVILYKKPKDRQNVTGKDLSRVYPQQDQQLQPAVGFEFNHQGGRKFGNLTREHMPEEDGFRYRLAIILDGLVMSAPVIEDEIRDTGIIRGVRANEVSHLITILQSGSLPASLNPTPLQEEKIGPTLGEDTINKGIRAIVISMLVVPLFMIYYYRFAGVVAVLALVMNMILLVGSMALFGGTFTLPGLAGLALTIGMGVDANVLIFERMREEMERGASMTQQIRNGFTRAWLTIFDSNVCTALSSMVLYEVGTEEIKGFALTLIIGLAWNLFTAVYASRVVFEYWNARGWLKKLTMLKILDKTNIDFIGPRKYFMTGSVIVIALGLVAVVKRDRTLYNIDFTGGTLVTVSLNDQSPEVRGLSPSDRVAFVRKKASVLPDVTVESLNVEGEQTGVRFNIRTTLDDVKGVQALILKSFGPSLAPMTFTPGQPVRVETEGAEKPAGSAGTKFARGTEFHLRYNTPQEPARIATAFANVLQKAKVADSESHFEVFDPNPVPAAQGTVGAKTLVLRTDLDPKLAEQELQVLQQTLATDPNMLFDQLTNFGGTVAGETRMMALVAVIASWLIIIAYLWLRFKSLTFGLAAVIAVVHDVLITLGAVAVTYWLALIPGVRQVLMVDQFKIDLPMIAAFLTLIGFSVNDTIVIFDRIREIRGKTPYLTADIINAAMNQTLSRTILTSFTAWMVVVILYIFGGEGLHGFSFCLVVGFLSGTYSTIYIASPILIDWAGKRPDRPGARSEGGALVTSR